MILALLVYVSCKPSPPGGVMSEDKLEEVLYDYHLALAMAENNENKDSLAQDREALRYLYTRRVFDKHGITEAEFDSAMVWYCSNGVKLQQIYKNLNGRFDAEAKELGVGLSDTEIYAAYGVDGDTSNVWNASKIVFLSNFQPDNVLTISIPCDSTFLPGDSYKLSYNANFLPAEGHHLQYSLFCVYFEDGSSMATTQLVNGNYKNELNLHPKPEQEELHPTKVVVTLYAAPAQTDADAQLFFMTYPSILRIHAPKKVEKLEPEDVELPVDTLLTDSIIEPEAPRLTPLEERDNREQRHDIRIVKERIPQNNLQQRRRMTR